MYDARKLPVFPYALGSLAVALHSEAIALSGIIYILRVGAVTGHSAVGAHLLQRYPFAVIRHDHSKRRGTAFERFELHYHGYFCRTLCDSRFYSLFTHYPIPLLE